MKKKKKRSDSLDIWIIAGVLLAVAVIVLVFFGIHYMNEEPQTAPSDTRINPADTAPPPAASGTEAITISSSSASSQTTASSETSSLTTSSITFVLTETTAETTEIQSAAVETTTSVTAVPVIETSGATTSETAVTVASTTETTAASTTEQTAAAASDTYELSYFSDDLFIGDSIYTGLYLYGYFPKSQVFAAVGMGPNTASTVEIDGYTAAGRAGEMKPPHIFIMLGTNGLAYLDASFMADSMKTLVNGLHEASPDSRIYVISIPPVTYEHELIGNETMAKVNKYNSLLETAAGECGAEYLDLCGQLQNDNGYFSSKYAEADGLHFLGAAYKKMLSFLQSKTQ